MGLDHDAEHPSRWTNVSSIVAQVAGPFFAATRRVKEFFHEIGAKLPVATLEMSVRFGPTADFYR